MRAIIYLNLLIFIKPFEHFYVWFLVNKISV